MMDEKGRMFDTGPFYEAGDSGPWTVSGREQFITAELVSLKHPLLREWAEGKPQSRQDAHVRRYGPLPPRETEKRATTPEPPAPWSVPDWWWKKEEEEIVVSPDIRLAAQ
jgi:hypothetical protein